MDEGAADEAEEDETASSGSEDEGVAAWKFSLGDKVTVLCNVQDADENDVQEWFEGVVVDQKIRPGSDPPVQAFDVKFGPAPDFGWEEETSEWIYLDKRSMRLVA